MTSTKNRLTTEELMKLRSMDFSTKPGFVKASDFLEEQVGPKGSKERDEFEAKARAWYQSNYE